MNEAKDISELQFHRRECRHDLDCGHGGCTDCENTVKIGEGWESLTFCVTCAEKEETK